MDQLGQPPSGFVFLMCFITWANRMLNISTSGKWVTVALLFITFLPIIISLDNLISNILNLFSSTDTTYNFIPIDNYNFFISGLLFLIAFWGFTYKYQRSFSYAVTTNAIIFQHAFLLSRSHRRILFDRISEVMVERTPMGTMLGYATVTIMTDSGVGLVEESVGVSAGAEATSREPHPQQTMALLQKPARACSVPCLPSSPTSEPPGELTMTHATASTRSESGKTSK